MPGLVQDVNTSQKAVRWMSNVRRLTVGLALVALLTACGTGDVSPQQETEAPLDLSSGYATIPVELSPRQSPLILPAGDRVLVYGGEEIRNGKPYPVDSGATYDPMTGVWKQIPSAGFPAPLLQVAGVWTGKEAVVIGTPCEAATGDDGGEGLSGCEPGGIAAAAFSPATGSWREFGSVDSVPKGRGPGGQAFTSHAVGWNGTEAVFFTTDIDGQRLLLLFNPERNESRLVATVSRADAFCVVDNKVLAVVTGYIDENGGSVSPNPAAAAEPLRTFELDQTGRWNELSPVAKPDSKDAVFERVPCDADQLAYLPVKERMGFGAEGLWWDRDNSEWAPLPAFGEAGYQLLSPSIADVGGVRTILLPESGAYFLPSGADVWQRRAAPAGIIGIVGPVGDLLLTKAAPTDDGKPVLGFMNVARYSREGPP